MNRTHTIEFESPNFEISKHEVTSEELAQWEAYANAHLYLIAAMHEQTLVMFLSHYRRGINLNTSLPKNDTNQV